MHIKLTNEMNKMCANLVVSFFLVKSFYEGFQFLLDLTNFLCRHTKKAKRLHKLDFRQHLALED